MSKSRVKAFVQARMSSSRYPGKVLAPFRGEPLIRHVIRAIESVLPSEEIILTTSSDRTDDALARYMDSLGVKVWRGSLEDVFSRYVMCLCEYPCEWILRINGDSPLLFPELVRLVAHQADYFVGDLVTTIFPRTFPRGQNAELINTATLKDVATKKLTPNDLEHVTPYFYRHAKRFRIMNIESGNPKLAGISMAVDTKEDLHRLEGMSCEQLRELIPPILMTKATT